MPPRKPTEQDSMAAAQETSEAPVAPDAPQAPPAPKPDPKPAPKASDDVASALAAMQKQIDSLKADKDELVERVKKAESRVDEVAPEAPKPPPLHVTAGFWPYHVQATKDMRGKQAAELAGVEYERLIGYGVRAPLDIDAEPIDARAVLIVVLDDGSKVAVPLTQDAEE